MSKTRNEVIGGVLFPVTTFDNGITVIDYPMMAPIHNVGKTSGMMENMIQMAKDLNYTVILNGNEYGNNRD